MGGGATSGLKGRPARGALRAQGFAQEGRLRFGRSLAERMTGRWILELRGAFRHETLQRVRSWWEVDESHSTVL